MTNGRFTGKTALITGGGTGLGRAVAMGVVAEGGRVVLMGRRPEPLASAVAQIGPQSRQSCGDASVAEDVRAAVSIASEFGGIDLLVCAAGGGGMAAVGNLSDADWMQAMNTTVSTAFVAARETLPSLRKSRGSIVFISSMAGLFSGPASAGYVTGKHALLGLTRSICRDYGQFGIRANAVCPGWMKTEKGTMIMSRLAARRDLVSTEAAFELATRDVPMGRAATPEEIAKIVLFLGSSDASIISGAILTADGGASSVDVATLAFG